MKESILCSISTRGRSQSSLPMAIQSVITQTRKPNKLIIFDDNDEQIDLRETPIYNELFPIIEYSGIEWEVRFGGKVGQHHNHQIANTMGYDWVWRLDDDTFATPTVLEELCGHISDDVGAIGGPILTPSISRSFGFKTTVSGSISDIDSSVNPQWQINDSILEVEHLHCSFLYRAGIVDYNTNLSRVGHREETLFSNRLFKQGYRLLVLPAPITWHLKVPNGGIRSNDHEIMYSFDESIFREYLSGREVTVVVLDNGRGDHICFKHMMHEIENPVVFSCYPEIVPGRSIAEAQLLFGDLGRYNIYQKMYDWGWKDSIENAFKQLYARNI